MQKSYESGTATHIGPESCGAARKGSVEALTGNVRAGYYGVPWNQNALWMFRFQVGRLWHRALSRRSQVVVSDHDPYSDWFS
jgi:hypothetical protein